MIPPLHDWETFYVIVGSSAAALTGLQFVVVALVSETKGLEQGTEALHAFGTPTIVHFCTVLLIGAICSMPGHSALTLSWCLALCGLAGIAYVINVIIRSRRQTSYKPVFEDWLFHTILPMVAYVLLLVAGHAESKHPVGALYFIAVTALLLLFVGIHNAWDTAVYIAAHRND